MFKKFSFDLSCYDIDTLPDQINALKDHPVIEEVFNIFINKSLLSYLKTIFLPMFRKAEILSSIEGGIELYLTISKAFSIWMELKSKDWFEEILNFLEELDRCETDDKAD
jgi:hypothetical protein